MTDDEKALLKKQVSAALAQFRAVQGSAGKNTVWFRAALDLLTSNLEPAVSTKLLDSLSLSVQTAKTKASDALLASMVLPGMGTDSADFLRDFLTFDGAGDIVLEAQTKPVLQATQKPVSGRPQ
jgi:hypothetical protein